MGMSVDGYYEPNDVKKVSNDVEEERSIESVANQSVDKDTLRHIEGMREFFKNNEGVANQLKRNRDKLFTSEYSTNDADSRFAERLSRLEWLVKNLEKRLDSGVEKTLSNSNVWKLVFHDSFLKKDSDTAYA